MRALNDYEHDAKVGEETPVVLMFRVSKGLVKKALDDCVNHFENVAQSLWKDVPIYHREVGEKLYHMTNIIIDEYRRWNWIRN